LIPYAFVDVDNAAIRYNKDNGGEKEPKVSSLAINWHDYKMTVMLKPHLWVNHGFYTGNLNFETDAEWTKWKPIMRNTFWTLLD
jgi:hypothetical protein